MKYLVKARALIRELMPAALHEVGPARGGLWAVVALPLGPIGCGRAQATISERDLVQQRVVVQALVRLLPRPQLPQDNAEGVHIHLGEQPR